MHSALDDLVYIYTHIHIFIFIYIVGVGIVLVLKTSVLGTYTVAYLERHNFVITEPRSTDSYDIVMRPVSVCLHTDTGRIALS